MTNEQLDQKALYYAAEKLAPKADNTFRVQDIKQAYIDGYNASKKDKDNESNKETI